MVTYDFFCLCLENLFKFGYCNYKELPVLKDGQASFRQSKDRNFDVLYIIYTIVGGPDYKVSYKQERKKI